MSLVEAGWDPTSPPPARAAHHRRGAPRRRRAHRGPASGPAAHRDDRQYLTCDATCEVWFERHGQVIGAGRATRTISRRLRRALEHRDRTCVVPGCGATRGLHAHHIRALGRRRPHRTTNLVLVCPYHHRVHHRGDITITGPADHLIVTDSDGQTLTNGSLARPPNPPPPAVPPCPDQPANAPTGGGTNPSNHNHRRQQLGADRSDRGRANQLGVLREHAGGVDGCKRLESCLARVDFGGIDE